jgi:molybdate transport system substrate-binding protein
MKETPMKTRFAVLIFVIVSLTLSGSTTAAQEPLIVFAAASLADAFEEIAVEFQAQQGVEVLYNFGGSPTLAGQLAEGAPADVFASANARQMQVAQEAGRIGGTPRTFVRNRLVVIVPASNPAGIESLRDLANDGVLLVVAAPDVPVRDYTNTMLDRLAADPGYGEAYREAVIANIVSEEEDVRAVAARVSLNEADAGIVYTSDVTPDIADQVIMIDVPDQVNTIAAYPIAITSDSANPELAQAFVDFVLSDAGQSILTSWNFISARIPDVPYVVTLPTDGTLAIGGQVLNPYTLTADTLRADFTPRTESVSYLSGEETVSATYTGALLWEVIGAAQPNFNPDVPNDRLSTFILVTGSDGYQAVLAWAEIDPEFVGTPILLAYDQDAAPIDDERGPIRLVVPGDARGGRYVAGVVDIRLFDAPAPDNME